MVDTKNFDAFPSYAIHRDVWQRRKPKLPRAFFPARTTPTKPLFQRKNCVVELSDGWLLVTRVVFLEVSADVLDVSHCGGRPADSNLRTQHLLEQSLHFLLFHELTPVGLRDPFLYSRAKTGVLLEQAQGGLFD